MICWDMLGADTEVGTLVHALAKSPKWRETRSRQQCLLLQNLVIFRFMQNGLGGGLGEIPPVSAVSPPWQGGMGEIPPLSAVSLPNQHNPSVVHIKPACKKVLLIGVYADYLQTLSHFSCALEEVTTKLHTDYTAVPSPPSIGCALQTHSLPLLVLHTIKLEFFDLVDGFVLDDQQALPNLQHVYPQGCICNVRISLPNLVFINLYDCALFFGREDHEEIQEGRVEIISGSNEGKLDSLSLQYIHVSELYVSAPQLCTLDCWNTCYRPGT